MMYWERTDTSGYTLRTPEGVSVGSVHRGNRLDSLTYSWRTFGADGTELPCSGWQFLVFAKREVEEAIRYEG